MFGTVLHDANYIAFAKDEIYHLGFSIVLLLGFSGLIVLSCNISDLFFTQTFVNLGTTTCYSPGTSVNSIATCYIQLAKNDAKSLTERYINQYIEKMMDSTWSVSLQIPFFNAYTATVGAYKKVVSNQYSMIANTFLVPALMSISMQKFILTFVSDNIIKWILPTAFLLRFAPPTRHMGNIFIAIAIGLYILLPLLYVFNLAMYDVVLNDCSSFARAACDNMIDNTNCYSSPSSAAQTCSNPDSMWYVARLIPQAFFLPNLTIVLLITFLSSIHKALRVIG
jgi:hypothetical protein